MMELRDQKCKAHFGDDVWSLAGSKTKAIFNFLCGNHTRNLPIVRYNKVFTKSISCPRCCEFLTVNCADLQQMASWSPRGSDEGG